VTLGGTSQSAFANSTMHRASSDGVGQQSEAADTHCSDDEEAGTATGRKTREPSEADPGQPTGEA
jgi:hypothetical protein